MANITPTPAELWPMNPAAVVHDGTLKLRNESVDLLGIRDGKYRAAIEVVKGEPMRVVIDLTDPISLEKYSNIDGNVMGEEEPEKA